MRTPTTTFLAGQTRLTQAVINRQWWLQLYSTIETSIGTQIVKTQRPGKLMYQNSYMSIEMCFQNISQRECHYRNRMTMLLTSWKCYDLAKRLSHYLYFFSFLFFFFFFGLITTRWSVEKYHVTLSQCHNGHVTMSQSQCVTWLE